MKVVILGGTGTLGVALTDRLVGKAEVVVFSRGEMAQKVMRERFPGVTCVIGDVRDRSAVRAILRGAETVFLLAAIKHIDLAEANPLEAVKTNVLGAVNVAEEAIAAGVSYVVFSNTDKSVLPVTTYGYSKALAQNYLLAQNGGFTRFSAFAWGNIIASRGSVIPTFVRAIREFRPVPVTDPKMSRFWLTIDAAADFMLSYYRDAPCDRAMIPPVKGATVVRVIESLARVMGESGFSLDVVGLRGIEKFHEVLESSHRGCLRSDTCAQYTDAELDALLAPCAEIAC